MNKSEIVKNIKDNKTFLQIISCLIASFILGILVGLFQVGMKYFYDFIEYLKETTFDNKTPLILYIFGAYMLFLLSLWIAKILKDKVIKKSMEFHNLKEETKIPWFQIPFTILLLCTSMFAGFPTSWMDEFEIISCSLGKQTRDVLNTSDDGYLELEKASSLSALLVSPLAGLMYGMESKKRINVFYILKLLLMLLISLGISYLIKYLFNIESWSFFKIKAFESFSWTSLYIYLVLGIVLAVVALAIHCFKRIINKKIEKRRINKKKMAAIATWVILIINFVCLFFGLYEEWTVWPLAGFDGQRLLMYLDLDRYNKEWLLILVTLIWLLYVAFIPYSTLPFGNQLPTIILGALIGIIVASHGINSRFMEEKEMSLMVLVSMFSFWGIMNKKPLTAVALILTCSVWKTIPYELIPIILALVPGILTMYFSKIETNETHERNA